MIILTATSEPDDGFAAWEAQYTEFIQNDGNVFEFNQEESQEPNPVQPEKDQNRNILNIIDKLKAIREVNEFALQHGNQGLFLSTRSSIIELEKMRTDGSTLVQPTITQFFK